MSKHQRQALRAAAMALALCRHRSGPSKDSSIRHESEPMRRKYKRREAATFINAARDPLAEREQRAASDTRTEVQRWLGDPPLSRPALAHHNAAKRQPVAVDVPIKKLGQRLPVHRRNKQDDVFDVLAIRHTIERYKC